MVYDQPDDTYFVEDDYHRAPRSFKEDFTKLSGRRRQEALANELSKQACDSYIDDIIQHMHQMEAVTLADVASMDIQHEIQWYMRPYLVDFLVEAHAAFQLLPETLFLAINLLDRYCSRRVVYKRHYQLVGCAALLIAAKYGDRKERVPLIRELKSMCCSLYDEDMFTQMEWHVLNTLEWVIGHPTVDSFIRLALLESSLPLSHEDGACVEHLAWYLCEIASYHKEFVSKKPSVMASATLALAQAILGRPEIMDMYGYEVRQTIVELSQKIDRPSQVLYRKYASAQFYRASIIVENFLREQETLQRRSSPPQSPTEILLHDKNMHSSTESYPGTPPKQTYPGTMVNGYMTPPITPDSEYFLGTNQRRGYPTGSPCPITPTPSSCSYQSNTYSSLS